MKRCAFTLAELLVSVLIISIIMVVLAPVITRRMKDTLTVQTDNIKGLEIYTNPGTYSFDVPIGINTLFIQGSGGAGGGAGATYVEKETSFTSTTNWTVPKGVYQITITITGSGGGGGGGNGGNSGATSCENNPGTAGKPNSSELSKYPLFKIVRGASDGSDLCMFKRNAGDGGIWPYPNEITFKQVNQSCTMQDCCWYAGSGETGITNSNYLYSYKGNKRTVCKYQAAQKICTTYGETTNHTTYGYRLPTTSEIKNVEKFINEYSANAGETGLQLCAHNYSSNKIPQCAINGLCLGADASNRCQAMGLWTKDATVLGFWNDTMTGQLITSMGYGANTGEAYSARCVKNLYYYTPYSGAGGASGAIMEQTINVLPKDVLEITIGSGGNGGSAKNNGSQGATTKIVHKRGGVELGTYYVKGGLGGKAATTSANGSAYTNGTASNNTTVSGTCYAKSRKDSSSSFSGGNTSCNVLSYSGESGTSTKGGNGGRVKNTGTINNGEASSGGYLYIDSARTANQRATDKEISYAKGQNASEYGFGGGGGLTPAWANSASHFYQGGKGASGRVDIKYKVALPGGGGGSAARVAGVNNDNKMYEIKYKVKEGARIVFIVGSGGSGGVEGQDGLNGSATIVGDKDIVFMAGEGGKVASESDKASLIGGRGGYSGYINEDDNVQSVSSGIKLKSMTPAIEYTFNPAGGSFKGQAGRRGGVPSTSDIQSGYAVAGTVFEYGFSGGMGGSPFNVANNQIGAAVTCGGGIYGTLGQMTSVKYLCTSGNISGNNARSHDPVNNEFGGSGGGGGGVVADSFEQGKGGNGSSGYLRIRWDVTEQE